MGRSGDTKGKQIIRKSYMDPLDQSKASSPIRLENIPKRRPEATPSANWPKYVILGCMILLFLNLHLASAEIVDNQSKEIQDIANQCCLQIDDQSKEIQDIANRMVRMAHVPVQKWGSSRNGTNNLGGWFLKIGGLKTLFIIVALMLLYA